MALPKTHIWQHKKWPELTFDHQAVGPAIAAARRLQWELQGKAVAIGLNRKGEVATEVLAQEVIATAAIEGEKLDPVAVRSSVMRHLGWPTPVLMIGMSMAWSMSSAMPGRPSSCLWTTTACIAGSQPCSPAAPEASPESRWAATATIPIPCRS